MFNKESGFQSVEVYAGENACASTDDNCSRICNSNAKPSVKDCWVHILARCRRAREGRRLSAEAAETGASLFTGLRKSMTDVYDSVEDGNPYADFVGSLIKESKADAPVVFLVFQFPAGVGDVISST